MIGVAYETFLLGRRAFLRWARVPGNWISTLFFPLIQLVLFSQLFKDIIQLPGFKESSYLAYLAPGQIVFAVFLGVSWVGINLLMDYHNGYLDKLRTVGLLERLSKGSNTGTKDLADVYRLTIPSNLLDVMELLPPNELGEAVDTGDQWITPDQSSPLTTGQGEAVDTHDEAVDTGDYYQSSPMTQPVVTHGDLPDQSPPNDQNNHHSAALLRPATPPAKACGCVEGWFDHDAGAMPCQACRPVPYRRFRQRTTA